MAEDIRWIAVRLMDSFDELTRIHQLLNLASFQYNHQELKNRHELFQLLHELYMEKADVLFTQIAAELSNLDCATKQNELSNGATHRAVSDFVQNQRQPEGK
jgi:hypothetical protein